MTIKGILDLCTLKSREKVIMNTICAIRNSPSPSMKDISSGSSSAISAAAQSKSEAKSSLPLMPLIAINASAARLSAGTAFMKKSPGYGLSGVRARKRAAKAPKTQSRVFCAVVISFTFLFIQSCPHIISPVSIQCGTAARDLQCPVFGARL